MPKSKINKLYGKPVKSVKENKAEDDALLKKARERARDGATYWNDNWEAAEDDLKFLSGEQWPSQVRTERELEERPCLVNNVLPTFVDQVLGDQRQNRPSIKVSPTNPVLVPKKAMEPGQEDAMEPVKISNVTGTKQYELSEVYTGLIRNIEYNCDAETAYDMSFEAAVSSGMGYLRVLSDYACEDGFEQELKVKHINNQFAVIIDPGAKEHDRSDMNWGFIDDSMEKEAFRKAYPDARAEPVDARSNEDMGVWFSEKTVKVSEYFTREPVVKEMALLSDGRSVYIDELEPVVDELLEQGIHIIRTRKVKTFKVMWRKITGLDVLEGPIELKCTTIPVVPVWGKSITIKKRIIYRSLIRHAKDSQRMANYWDSAATEMVALAPKSPFIGMEEHVEGRENDWETANTKNHAILTYVPQFQGDPGPRRQPPAIPPAAEVALGMGATDKIKATVGIFDASIGAAGNETSGRAIVARQREADTGTFAFVDNLSKAIMRIGKLLVELVPYTYDTERVVRIKLPDETEDFVRLNEQVFDEETQQYVTINDLNVAKYDVVVTTGPSYSTQRVEAAESLIQFAQAVPQAAAVIADLIAQNMDFPGADVMAERLKKIMPPNVLSASERERLAEDMPEQTEPTPEQQLQAQEFEVKAAESQAKMAQADADVQEAQASVAIAQLKTEEAQLKLQQIHQGAEQGVQGYEQVRELVAQAIAELTG